MKNSTSIEVKCECKIPFHAELISYLQKLSSSAITDNSDRQEVPHKDAIIQALRSKLLFIKISHPIKKGRTKLFAAVKDIFKKELVGTIKVGSDEITLILL